MSHEMEGPQTREEFQLEALEEMFLNGDTRAVYPRFRPQSLESKAAKSDSTPQHESLSTSSLSDLGIEENLDIHYDKLDDPQREIRFLMLEPGKQDDPLAGSLETREIDLEIPFIAISYCWGEPHKRVSLGCFSQEQEKIPMDALRALRDVRHKEERIRIWIDSICIDQSNIEERQDQIQLMTYIYATARVVFAWLDHEVDLNLECFKRLSEFSVLVFEDEPNIWAVVTGDYDERMCESAERIDLGDDPSLWNPVVELMSNDYWNRVWVQQEIAVSKRYVIFCRGNRISGASLDVLAYKLHKLGDTEPQERNDGFPDEQRLWHAAMAFQRKWAALFAVFNAGSTAAAIGHVRPQIKTESHHIAREYDFCEGLQEGRLFHLLNRFTSLKVSNQRDRLYGVLALAKDTRHYGITANYALSVPATFALAIEFWIDKYYNLDFLLALSSNIRANGDTNPNDGHGIPSWIPDWTGDQKSLKRATDFGRHWASGGLEMEPQALTMQPLSLLIRGFCLYNVEASRPPFILTDRRIPMEPLPTLETFLGKDPLEDKRNVLTLWRSIFELDKANDSNYRKRSYANRRLLISLAFEVITTAVLAEMDEIDVAITMNDLITLLRRLRPMKLDTEHGRQLDLEIRTPLWTLCRDFRSSYFLRLSGMKLGMAEDGGIRPGDEVWIIFGCSSPMVLRPSGEDKYAVIAPIFNWGIMHAEAVTDLDPDADTHIFEEREHRIRTIHLV